MKQWYTAAEIAALLHVGARTTRRLLGPYRGQCHLARKGNHPRLLLWVPAKVVMELCEARKAMWASETRNPETLSSVFS